MQSVTEIALNRPSRARGHNCVDTFAKGASGVQGSASPRSAVDTKKPLTWHSRVCDRPHMGPWANLGSGLPGQVGGAFLQPGNYT